MDKNGVLTQKEAATRYMQFCEKKLFHNLKQEWEGQEVDKKEQKKQREAGKGECRKEFKMWWATADARNKGELKEKDVKAFMTKSGPLTFAFDTHPDEVVPEESQEPQEPTVTE